MQLNRFWSSVWEVVKFLAAVALLNYILLMVATGFGLLRGDSAVLVRAVVGVLAPAAGAMLYIDWVWNWRAEHIGLTRSPAAAGGWWLLGLAGGGVLALLGHVVSAALAGGGFSFPTGQGAPAVVNPLFLVILLLQAFSVELVMRGAAISRFQADLQAREVLIMAPLVPLISTLITSVFAGMMPTGVIYPYDIATVVALALLFIRTDSVWLTAGLRMGFLAALQLLNLRISTQGGYAVWGALALVLLAIEWFKQQRMPRRMPQRGGRSGGGRTIRGPWGPH
jgi:hypothetical protein